MANQKSGENKVRIGDIAERMGVSPATVSMVLNNRPGIPEETRQRILALAAEMGYQTKGSRARKTNPALTHIGVIMRADFASNVFYSDVLFGINMACKRHHLHLMYGTVEVDTANVPTEIPTMIQEEAVDAVLLVGIHMHALLSERLDRSRIPTVLVDGYSASRMYDSVLTDNYQSAYQAVHYLHSKGHRHIGLVGSDMNSYPSIKERRLSYLNAVNELNLPGPYFADSPLLLEPVQAATEKLLQEHPQITAILGVNDEALTWALEVARRVGRAIPEEISGFGIDDIVYATTFDPPLTTMRIDRVTMGQMAVELLFDRLQLPDAPPMSVLLKTSLIERQSVAERSER